jgi:hypothetical protein
MNLLNIFEDVKNSFFGIWQYRERGNTLEIITPYATTNNRFISVFLTKQGDKYIVSDGGWVSSGVYDIKIKDDTCFLKIFYHFKNSYNVEEISSKDGIIYYYNKSVNIIDIPSKIFDLSLFIQNIVSVSEIEFENKEEKNVRELFTSKANDYIKSIVTNLDKIKFNRYLDPHKREVKFNAIYYINDSKVSLLNYVTGSSFSYFSNSIFKANQLYEMAEDTAYKNCISSKITVVDTDADGYIPNKISPYLYHLINHTESEIVEWNSREKLNYLLN